MAPVSPDVAQAQPYVDLDPEQGRWRGHPDLVQFLRPVEELREDPRNSKLHPEFNLRATAASLRDHGQQDLLLVRPDGTMIGGSGRLRVATGAEYDLNWTHVAVLVNTSADAEARKLGMRLNRTGDLAEWDHEVLGQDVDAWRAAGEDLEELGWREDDLKAMFGAGEEPANAGSPPESQYREQYGVIVICEDEGHQQGVYDMLKEQGFQVRVVTT